jgi:hypothetical protein
MLALNCDQTQGDNDETLNAFWIRYFEFEWMR